MLTGRQLKSARSSVFACVLAALVVACLYAVCLATAPSAFAASGYLKVSTYKMDVRLDTEDDCLRMDVTATVKNKTSKSFSTLYFRNMAYTLIKQAKKDPAVEAVNEDKKTKIKRIRNLTTGKNLKFSLRASDKSIVKVKLGKKKLKPKKSMKIRLTVRTDVPDHDERFGFHEGGRGKLYYLAFCFPYLADYRAGKWSLNPLPEGGENRFSRATTYKVTFKAPKKYKVAATGTEKTKAGVTKIKATHARDFAIVACNYMKKDRFTVSGVKVTNWYLPGAYAKKYRNETKAALKDAVRYLSGHVGKAPYKQVDVVQVFGGIDGKGTVEMEYPGLLTMGGDRYYFKAGAAKVRNGLLVRTAYHEMTHQWFYAAVGSDEFREPWLDEGITSYYDKWTLWKAPGEATRLVAREDGVSAQSYVDAQRQRFRASLQACAKSADGTRIDRKASGYKGYFTTVYGTAAWFLVQLEEQVGTKKFDQIMRAYYKKYRFKEATTSKFLKVVRAYDNSAQVKALIRVYFG